MPIPTLLLLLFVWPAVSFAQEPDFDAQREAMVRELEEGGIEDPLVLEAMRRVLRHEFVPTADRDRSYRDRPLPIGHGQTISQPHVVALMTQVAGVRSGERVLEVGTGSGYQAAILAEMGARVYTIELVDELAREARERLRRLGYEDVTVRQGDGYAGWPDRAPFDAIVVTAAPERLPEALLAQLARGGRLVAPVGPTGGVQFLTLVEKDMDGSTTVTRLAPVRFVPMIEARPQG